MATMKPKILLVDDLDFLIEMEKEFLDQTPADIITAACGKDALRIIREERPQLVYLDTSLPDISGAECCRLIKGDQHLRQTPIVLIFDSEKEIAVNAMEFIGCDEVLAKPLKRKAFLNCGYRFLSGVERRNKRIPCHIPIHCQFEHNFLVSSAIDVSTNGVYVKSPIPVLPGSDITVSFSLPDGDKVIEGHGRIAWVNQGTQRGNMNMPQGFGVDLLEISPAGLFYLSNFVNTEADLESNRRENTLISFEKVEEPPPKPAPVQKPSLKTKKENGLSEH